MVVRKLEVSNVLFSRLWHNMGCCFQSLTTDCYTEVLNLYSKPNKQKTKLSTHISFYLPFSCAPGVVIVREGWFLKTI